MKQYIVDAFTGHPFSGNPAAVCVMDAWPSEEFMQKLAMENNLSETAFIVREKEGYHLRWFTPAYEVDLCGHATLASSWVILNMVEPGSESVQFHTRSGLLTIKRKGSLYEMDFPVYEQEEIPVSDAMEAAFGVRPVQAFLGVDLVCVFAGEEQVRDGRSGLRIGSLSDCALLVRCAGKGEHPGLPCLAARGISPLREAGRPDRHQRGSRARGGFRDCGGTVKTGRERQTASFPACSFPGFSFRDSCARHSAHARSPRRGVHGDRSVHWDHR